MLPKIYYYVEPCPRCGSRKTGHYVRTPLSGAGYTMETSLKNGELIRFARKTPLKNAFCENCGHEWATRVETKWWREDRIEEERVARGTNEKYRRMTGKRHPSGDVISNFANRINPFRSNDDTDDDYGYDEFDEYETDNDDDSQFDIIDSRQKDTIEILYTDSDMISKYLEVLQNETH